MRVFCCLAYVVTVILAIGCSGSGVPNSVKPTTLPGLPITLTIKSHSTVIIPGSQGWLHLTVNDVTKDQATISLAFKDGAGLIDPTSITTNKTARFTLGSGSYEIALFELQGLVAGDMVATIVISAATEDVPMPTKR